MPSLKVLLRIIHVAAACLALAVSLAAQAPPIPEIVHTGSRYQFLVDGKPYLMLGGQAHNSDSSNPADLQPVWETLEAAHGNTAEVPIYWELIEPERGHFDFSTLDDVIQGARAHHLRLVLLWFGSWKNGNMDYTPAWVKLDPTTYFHARNSAGQPIDSLSPSCEASREADEQAFAAAMRHIQSVDESTRTVILVQVENETGLYGSDRDYSPQGNRAYTSAVPAVLMSYLATHRHTLAPALETAWSGQHSPTAGTWAEVFGDLAPEAFSAWGVASYVNAVAAAGKKEYPLPMYCNNWLVNPGNVRAGEWPSGGPTIHVLDIWKAAAPSIDLLAPDIYGPPFRETAEAFRRPDNPLFVPEIAFAPYYAPYVFADLADFDGLGFSPFGIDDGIADGKLTPEGEALATNYGVLEPLLPLIAKYQGTGRLFSVVQNDTVTPAGWRGNSPSVSIPLRHGLAVVAHFTEPFDDQIPGYRAGGIIIELAPDDYVVAGSGFGLDFYDLRAPAPGRVEYLSIEEGTFKDGQWVTTRRLNGDEFHVTVSHLGPFIVPGPAFKEDVFARESGRILRVKLLGTAGGS
jgi:Domain of unknown function (DUF5597)/Glycosyl hydrolases family 35